MNCLVRSFDICLVVASVNWEAFAKRMRMGTKKAQTCHIPARPATASNPLWVVYAVKRTRQYGLDLLCMSLSRSQFGRKLSNRMYGAAFSLQGLSAAGWFVFLLFFAVVEVLVLLFKFNVKHAQYNLVHDGIEVFALYEVVE